MLGRLREWFGSRTDKSSQGLDHHALRTLASRAPKEMSFQVETEREADGRWIAEIPELPGVMAYGSDESDAVRNVAVLTLRVMADRLEHQEVRTTEAMHFSVVPRECVASR